MSIFKVLRTLVLLFAVVHAASSAATVIHVDSSATGPTHDGTSWCSAYLRLQDALAAAVATDEIRVAQGIYYPDEGAGRMPGDRTASFRLRSGVSLAGGFAGCGALDPDARNVASFQTVLSGDLDENDGPLLFQDNAENSYHVLTADGTNATALLDGFIIEGGNADDDVIPHDAGGGIRTAGGSPTIIGCIFRGNSAVFGGGMENFNGANPMVSETLFTQNLATFRGGGVHNNASSPSFIDCAFVANEGVNSGGGMRNLSPSTPTLTGCVFDGNHAGFGGGLVNDHSDPTLRNCRFTGNTSDDTSGAMHNYRSAPLVVNTVFEGNSAFTRGGAIFNLDSSVVRLVNCTLAGNSAGAEGGGMYTQTSATGIVSNTIVWDSVGGPFGGPGALNVIFSDVEGGWPGVGNIDADPLFDAGPPDILRLSFGSPCIDAGDNDSVPVGVTTDFDDNPRFVDDECTLDSGDAGPPGGPVVDIGAFEFQATAGCCDDDDCDDGNPCNGSEACDQRVGCQPGDPLDPDDGVSCTDDVCDDVLGVVNTPNDSLCDNGIFCDGAETCDLVFDCQAGPVPCAGLLCNEGIDTCVDCLSEADCDDGDPCNGRETCTEMGLCSDGVITDCNANALDDACDIAAGTSIDHDGNGVPDECEAQTIPTVSQWGLIVLTLLFLAGAKIRFAALAGSSGR